MSVPVPPLADGSCQLICAPTANSSLRVRGSGKRGNALPPVPLSMNNLNWILSSSDAV